MIREFQTIEGMTLMDGRTNSRLTAIRSRAWRMSFCASLSRSPARREFRWSACSGSPRRFQYWRW
jgi:hypothetical protein